MSSTETRIHNWLPHFEEEYSSKLPALLLLMQMGWRYVSPRQALEMRGGNTSEVVLRLELKKHLIQKRYVYAGSSRILQKKSLDSIVDEVCSPALNEGLRAANEKMYNHLLYGISVTEFVDQKKVSPTIALVDWENPENNSFIVTEEFAVTKSTGLDTRRPDIVGFLNGIPVLVIEAKRPDGQQSHRYTVEEGVSQHLRNQRNDEIPLLFVYSQLLLAISANAGRYATQGTDSKFYSAWREEEFSEEKMLELKNRPLRAEQKMALFGEREEKYLLWYENQILNQLALTDQDRLIIGLCDKSRLLEMIRVFNIFDTRSGRVVARYPQVFAIKKLLQKISHKKASGSREGGVIWHTTGSGKSYTMVFLSKALLLHEELKQCRVLVITDRVDLEEQLSKTFSHGGELSGKRDKENAMATSGKRLAEQISKGSERIIFSLIQKFNTATKQPDCHNPDSNIIVLIDEGHRSQGGENHARMKKALPNAAFIAFTGTPLLKDDKTTNKFGPIIHAYTMQRAVEDKTVAPLLYEERKLELEVAEKAIDHWFERITENLTPAQKADLKRKFSSRKEVNKVLGRIQLIAQDIAKHFSENIDDSLKGQLACEDKLSAIRYKEALDEIGIFESALIMSSPDTREGNTSVDESKVPEVVRWWKENIKTDEGTYTRDVLNRFAKDDKLKLIIVVDKLLTGFDEPKNSVLYIDKPLTGHNLIQAIARVNRLHPQKQFGLLIDYRGVLAELDTTIAQYQDLAANTQQGYEINDLEGLYHQVSTEYKRLPGLYQKLWSVFSGVKNTSDIEQLRQVLIPKMDGALVDANQKNRDDFNQALKDFAFCLKVALQSVSYFEDKSFDATRELYKITLKEFSNLRRLIRQDCGESISYDEYSEQIKKIMDKHVLGVKIHEPTGAYQIGSKNQSEHPEDWSEEKTRNETDIIKTLITKTIEQDLREDPYAKESFSHLLKKTIEEASQLFDSPLKQYMLFFEFQNKVKARKLDDMPSELEKNLRAQACYGLLKMELNHAPEIGLALNMDQIIGNCISENSINPINREAEITKKLLPLMFQECKRLGYGMDKAKNLIDKIIQMTRAHLDLSKSK